MVPYRITSLANILSEIPSPSNKYVTLVATFNCQSLLIIVNFLFLIFRIVIITPHLILFKHSN